MQKPVDPEDPNNERTIFDNDLMERCIGVFEDWIIDSTKQLGTDVRAAKKNVRVKMTGVKSRPSRS